MEVSAQQVLLSLFNAQDTVCLRVFADRKTCRQCPLSPLRYLPSGYGHIGLEALLNPHSRGNRQMRSLNSTDVRAPRVATLSDGFVNCF